MLRCLMHVWRRLRNECRDVMELIVAPALAAVLPWSLGFRVGRRLVMRGPLYREAAAQALVQYQQRFQVGDARTWLLVRRWITWIDHADHYLARTRSDAWMDRYLEVKGEWPPVGTPAMLLTFHWGAGMWGLRHAAKSGLVPRALVASTGGEPFRGRSVLGWYARVRTNTVRRALGCEPLNVSGSLRPAIKTLREGGQVLAAIDVPADQDQSAEVITLMGRSALVPRALHRLAVDQRVPVYVYLTGVNPATGMRTLNIVPLGVHDNVEMLVKAVFAQLQNAMETDSAAWHFWGEAPRFFRDKPPPFP